jgi:hypothetical protein
MRRRKDGKKGRGRWPEAKSYSIMRIWSDGHMGKREDMESLKIEILKDD